MAESSNKSMFTNFESNGKKLSIDVNNIDVSYVNSIRRTIFTDIPNVGFYFKLNDHHVDSNTNILVNDSPIHNEFLSHRISLIPICITATEIDKWSDNMYKFVLKAENTTPNHMDITTEHFEIFDETGEKLSKSRTKEIFPPNEMTKDFILITKLHPVVNVENPKKIHIEITARKGIAKDCICWSTVSQCSYFNRIDEELALKTLNEHVEKELKKENERTKSDIIADFNTLERYRCFQKNNYDEPNAFTFLLESECKLSPEYIFFKACTILISQLEELSVNIAKDDESNLIEIVTSNAADNFYTVSVKGHTHTIANLLQSNIMNLCVRGEDKSFVDYKLVYVGYCVPHPLEELFVIKLKFENDTSRRKLIEFLVQCIIKIKSELVQFTRDWIEYTLLYEQDIDEVSKFN